MSTIILNGSPKVDPKQSNTRVFCETFTSGMEHPCEVKRILGSDVHELAQYIRQFDEVIVIMPLYVHAVPGIVMKFFEALTPAEQGKSIGFIIQAGFEETSQERFVTAYLARLAARLGYRYLGTVSKGECAGIVEAPKAVFQKTLGMVKRLGTAYEKTGEFDRDVTAEMAKPYTFSLSQLRLFKVLGKLGLSNIFWHQKLKQNNAMAQRLDRPFL